VLSRLLVKKLARRGEQAAPLPHVPLRQPGVADRRRLSPARRGILRTTPRPDPKTTRLPSWRFVCAPCRGMAEARQESFDMDLRYPNVAESAGARVVESNEANNATVRPSASRVPSPVQLLVGPMVALQDRDKRPRRLSGHLDGPVLSGYLDAMARYSGGPVTHRALSGPSRVSGGAEAEKHELLYTLSCIRDVRAKIDRNELVVVRRARELDITWTEIATALGVSRQAAWERLRELDVSPTHR
jgi:hypothetical protein